MKTYAMFTNLDFLMSCVIFDEIFSWRTRSFLSLGKAHPIQSRLNLFHCSSHICHHHGNIISKKFLVPMIGYKIGVQTYISVRFQNAEKCSKKVPYSFMFLDVIGLLQGFDVVDSFSQPYIPRSWLV